MVPIREARSGIRAVHTLFLKYCGYVRGVTPRKEWPVRLGTWPICTIVTMLPHVYGNHWKIFTGGTGSRFKTISSKVVVNG
jgi:hypothetical protein